MNLKLFQLAVLDVLAVMLTGCWHNVATFSKVIRAVAGINPDTYMLSLGFDYGENVTIAVKEKAEAEYRARTQVMPPAPKRRPAASKPEASSNSRPAIRPTAMSSISKKPNIRNPELSRNIIPTFKGLL